MSGVGAASTCRRRRKKLLKKFSGLFLEGGGYLAGRGGEALESQTLLADRRLALPRARLQLTGAAT